MADRDDPEASGTEDDGDDDGDAGTAINAMVEDLEQERATTTASRAPRTFDHLDDAVKRRVEAAMAAADEPLPEAAAPQYIPLPESTVNVFVHALYDAVVLDRGLALTDTLKAEESLTRFEKAVLRYFYTNARRRVLSLANLGLGPRAASVVATFVHRHQCFDVLELGSNRLGDAGVNVLIAEKLFSDVPSLTTLDLSANDITPPGFVVLSEALTNSPIKDLNMSTEPHGRTNRLGGDGAMALAAALRTNESLISLRLAGVGGAGFSKLAKFGLGQCGDTSSLTSVDFSSNRLGERAFIRLCIALVSHRIREVNFARNPFSNLAAKALCELVGSSQTLLKLDLSGCNQSTTSLSAAHAPTATAQAALAVANSNDFYYFLADALELSPSMETLILDDNPVGNVGAGQLAYVLSHTRARTLRTLSMVNCDITQLSELAYGLSTNTALTRLNLRGNYVQDGGAIALTNALLGKAAPLQSFLLKTSKLDSSGELKKLTVRMRRKIEEEEAVGVGYGSAYGRVHVGDMEVPREIHDIVSPDHPHLHMPKEPPPVMTTERQLGGVVSSLKKQMRDGTNDDGSPMTSPMQPQRAQPRGTVAAASAAAAASSSENKGDESDDDGLGDLDELPSLKLTPPTPPAMSEESGGPGITMGLTIGVSPNSVTQWRDSAQLAEEEADRLMAKLQLELTSSPTTAMAAGMALVLPTANSPNPSAPATRRLMAIWQHQKQFLSKTAIQQLNLSRAGVGDAGALHLAALIQTNHAIQELLLADNDITDISGQIFIKALERLDYTTVSLKKVDFKKNRMSIELQRGLEKVLSKSRRYQQQQLLQFNSKKLRDWQRANRESLAIMQMHLDGVIDVESEHKRLVEEQTRALERFKHDEEIKTTQLEDELRNLIRENELIREEIRLSAGVLEDRKSHLKHSLRTQDKNLTAKLGAEKLKTADRAFKLTTRQGESDRLTKLVAAEVQQLQSDLDREKRARDGVNYFLKKSMGEYETFTVSVLTAYIAEMRRQERVKAEVAENLRKMAANRGDQKGAAMVIIKAEIVLDPSRFQGSTRILASHNMKTLAQLGLGGHVMVQLNSDSDAYKDLMRSGGALTHSKEASAAVRANSKAPELVTIIADKLHIPPSDIEGVYFMPRGVFFAPGASPSSAILPRSPANAAGRGTRASPGGRGRGAAAGAGGSDDDDDRRGNSLIGPDHARRSPGSVFGAYSKADSGLMSPVASDLPSYSAYLQGGGTAARGRGRGRGTPGSNGSRGRRVGKNGGLGSPTHLGLPGDFSVQGDSPTPSARARELELSEGGGTVGSSDQLSARPSPGKKPHPKRSKGQQAAADAAAAIGAAGHTLGSDFSIAAAIASAAKKAPASESVEDSVAAAGNRPPGSADGKLGSPPGTGISRAGQQSNAPSVLSGKDGVHESDTDTDTDDDDSDGDEEKKDAPATTGDGQQPSTATTDETKAGGAEGATPATANADGKANAGAGATTKDNGGTNSKPGSAKAKKAGSRPGTGKTSVKGDTPKASDGKTGSDTTRSGAAPLATGRESSGEDLAAAAGLVDSRPRTADDRPVTTDSQMSNGGEVGTPSNAASKTRPTGGFMKPIDEDSKVGPDSAARAKLARKQARKEQRREEKRQMERNGSESARARYAEEQAQRRQKRAERRQQKEEARLAAAIVDPRQPVGSRIGGNNATGAPSGGVHVPTTSISHSRINNREPTVRVRSAEQLRLGASPQPRANTRKALLAAARANGEVAVDDQGQPIEDDEAAANDEAEAGEVVLDEDGQPIAPHVATAAGGAAGGYFRNNRANRLAGRQGTGTPTGGLGIPGFGGADMPGSNRIVTVAQLQGGQRRGNSRSPSRPIDGDGTDGEGTDGEGGDGLRHSASTGELPFGARMAARALARAELDARARQRLANSASLPSIGTRLTADGRRVPLRSGAHGASAFGPYDPEQAAAAAAAQAEAEAKLMAQYPPVEYVNAPAPHIGTSVMLRGHAAGLNRRSTAPNGSSSTSATGTPPVGDVTWEESGGLLLPHVTAGYGTGMHDPQIRQLGMGLGIGASPLRGTAVGLTSPGMGRSVGGAGKIMRGGGGALRSPAGQVRLGAPGGAAAIQHQAGDAHAHVISYGTLGAAAVVGDNTRQREPMVSPLQQQQYRVTPGGGSVSVRDRQAIPGPWSMDTFGNPIAQTMDGATIVATADGTVVSNSVRPPRVGTVLTADLGDGAAIVPSPNGQSGSGAAVLGGGFARRPTAPVSPRSAALLAAQQASGVTIGPLLAPPSPGLALGGDGRPIPTFPNGTIAGGMPPPVVHHLQSGVSPRHGRARDRDGKPENSTARDGSEEKTRDRSMSPVLDLLRRADATAALKLEQENRRADSRSPTRNGGRSLITGAMAAGGGGSIIAKVIKPGAANQGRSIMGKDQEKDIAAALSAMLPLRGVGSGVNPPLNASTTPIAQTVKQARVVATRAPPMQSSPAQHHQYIHGGQQPPYLLTPMTSIPSVNGSLSVIPANPAASPSALLASLPSAASVMASPIAGRLSSRQSPLNDMNTFGSTPQQHQGRALSASASMPTLGSRVANPTLSLSVGTSSSTNPPLRAKYSFASSTHGTMSDGVSRSTTSSSVSHPGTAGYSVAAANHREQAERQARMARIEARRMRDGNNSANDMSVSGVTFAPGTVSPQPSEGRIKRLAPSSSAPQLGGISPSSSHDNLGGTTSSLGAMSDTSGDNGGTPVTTRSTIGAHPSDVLVIDSNESKIAEETDGDGDNEDDIVEQRLPAVAPVTAVPVRTARASLSPRAAAAALEHMHGTLDRLPSIDITTAVPHVDPRPRSSGSPSAAKRRQSSVLEPDVQTSPGGRRAPLHHHTGGLHASGNNMEAVAAGISNHLARKSTRKQPVGFLA